MVSLKHVCTIEVSVYKDESTITTIHANNVYGTRPLKSDLVTRRWKFFERPVSGPAPLGHIFVAVSPISLGTMLSLIARFMGPTWGPYRADRLRWAPCWPHELYYLGYDSQPNQCFHLFSFSVWIFQLIIMRVMLWPCIHRIMVVILP